MLKQKTFSVLVSAATLMAAHAALAGANDVLSGAVSTSLAVGEVGSEDYVQPSVGIATDLQFAPNVDLGFFLDFDRADFADGDIETDLARIGLEPRYRFDDGVWLGAYYQEFFADLAMTDIWSPSVGIEGESFGLSGGFDADRWSLAGYLGRTEPHGDDNGDVDIRDIGLSGSFAAARGLNLFGNMARSRLDLRGDRQDIDLLAAGAEYRIADPAWIYGSLSYISANDILAKDADITELAAGLRFDMGDWGQVPVIANVELVHAVADIGSYDHSADTIRAGFTIPFGNDAGRSVTSASRVARGDIHSALFAARSSYLSLAAND